MAKATFLESLCGLPFFAKRARATESGTNIDTALSQKQDDLGISASGDAGKFLNQQGQWISASGTPYQNNPEMDGTASAGSSGQFSRGDHVHPTDTSREAVANKDSSIPSSPVTGHYPSTGAVVNFVNSSIASATANFLGNFSLTDLGVTYDDDPDALNVAITAALNAKTWPTGFPTNNDYVYIEVKNPSTTGVDDRVERFKYADLLASWGYEYTLNNSSFTAQEIAAIDSGITSGKVSGYDSHLSDSTIHVTSSDKSNWNGKQNALPTSGTPSTTYAINVSGNAATVNGKTVAVNVPADAKFTDTTYESKSAVNGGTDVSLCTTGEKYTWNHKYTKPSTGIPKTDLASGVQTSLGLADTAYQKPSGGIPDSDIASASTWNGKQDSLGINSSTGDAAKFLNEKGQFVAASVSVTDNNPTLDWNTTSKVGTVGSTDLRVTMPANPASYKVPFINIDSSLASLDLNTLTTQGFYYCAGFTSSSVVLSNIPSELNNYTKSWRLEVINQRSRIEQLLVNASDNGEDATRVMGIWKRHRFSDGTSWTPWVNMRDASWINSGTFDAARIPASLPNTGVEYLLPLVHFGARNITPSTRYALIAQKRYSGNDSRPGEMFRLFYNDVFIDFKTYGLIKPSAQTATLYVAPLQSFGISEADWADRLHVTWTNNTSAQTIDVNIYFKFDDGENRFVTLYQYNGQAGGDRYNYTWTPYQGIESQYAAAAAGTEATYEWDRAYCHGSAVYASKIGSYDSHPSIGSTTTPVYVKSDGTVAACSTSDMSVGSATYSVKPANGCVRFNAEAGRGVLATYNYPSDSNSPSLSLLLTAVDTQNQFRGKCLLDIVGRGNSFSCKMYNITGSYFTQEYTKVEVTADSTEAKLRVYISSTHADWMYVFGTIVCESVWGGNQANVSLSISNASSSTTKLGTDVTILMYNNVISAAASNVGDSQNPVFVGSTGVVGLCMPEGRTIGVYGTSSDLTLSYPTAAPGGIHEGDMIRVTNTKTSMSSINVTFPSPTGSTTVQIPSARFGLFVVTDTVNKTLCYSGY